VVGPSQSLSEEGRPLPDANSYIDTWSAAWEASIAAGHMQPAAPTGWLVELGIEPSELLLLVNRIRGAHGLSRVGRLGFGCTVPDDENRCLFAMALRCQADNTVLRFERPHDPAAVARELGVGQDDEYEGRDAVDRRRGDGPL
jgi:hypothetical protein